MVRDVVVDDQNELLDVQPSGSDGSRDDDRKHSRLEVVDRFVSIDLFLASVKGVDASVGLLVELEEEVVCCFLPFDEDEGSFLVEVGFGLVGFSQEFEESIELGFLCSNLDELFDLLSDDGTTSDGDLEGFVKDFPSETVHLFGEGRGEEDDLTAWSDVVDDFHDLERGGKEEEKGGEKVSEQFEGEDASRAGDARERREERERRQRGRKRT